MRVAIVGAGGHGKVVWDILTAAGHEVVGFVDANESLSTTLGLPVVRELSSLAADGVVVAIGDNRARQRHFEALRAAGHRLVNAIHPSAVISPRTTLGEGLMIVAGAIVNVDGHIGDNAIINTGASIDHDCRIGAHAHLAPGTALGGNVTVEEGAFLGIGARAIPGVRIGAWATCGAGAVVLRDVPPGSTVVGVPARPLGAPAEPVGSELSKVIGSAATPPAGAAVRTTPLPPWPHFAPDELEATMAVLRSGKVNYWTGEEGRRFEEEYAATLGRRHAIALANGTVALELALLALGIGPGDEVVTTPRTFIASASCVVMRGATPVLADVDPVSQNLTAESVAAVLTPRTKAIIAVHLAGWPCDMDGLMALAEKHGIVVIEDCAQAHGATYKGRPVGSFGHAAAFSFCQDKIITTGGEGGLLVLDDEAHWKKAWAFKDHGKSHDAVHAKAHPPGFRWLHESFGTNWRLTEMQAAIGRRQLTKLPEWTERRRRHAEILTETFSRLPALRVTTPAADIGHAYYKYYAFVRPEMLKDGWDRDRVMSAITAEGVPCFSGSCSEIYLEKAFAEALRPPERLPIAKELGETSLMFLVHPTLTEADMRDMCLAVEKVLHVATRDASLQGAHVHPPARA